jgi:hypothetical protein
VFAVSIAVWLGAVGAGFHWLWQYEMTPGPVQSAPPAWPQDSTIERKSGVATVVMFAHPLCPCSRASVAELGELLRRSGAVDAHLLTIRPEGVGPEWSEGLLGASAISGLRVTQDRNGVEARRFGAHTSGHVVIYDAGGRLRFSGGITGARGHFGDNASLDRAVGSLSGGVERAASSPVYGCCLEARQ